MYFRLTSYALINNHVFKRLKSVYNENLKKIHEIFQKGVLKYFKISMKFLNISKWNISSCISRPKEQSIEFWCKRSGYAADPEFRDPGPRIFKRLFIYYCDFYRGQGGGVRSTECSAFHFVYYPALGRGTGCCFRAISFFVSLSATLRENGWTDLREIFMQIEGVEWPWNDLIKFWGNSGKRVGGSKVSLFVITGHGSEDWR